MRGDKAPVEMYEGERTEYSRIKESEVRIKKEEDEAERGCQRSWRIEGVEGDEECILGETGMKLDNQKNVSLVWSSQKNALLCNDKFLFEIITCPFFVS
jgi:hypothetical protein